MGDAEKKKLWLSEHVTSYVTFCLTRSAPAVRGSPVICHGATLNQAVTLLLQPLLPQAFLRRPLVSFPIMASTSYLLHLFTCSKLKWHPWLFSASFKYLFLLSNTHKYTYLYILYIWFI